MTIARDRPRPYEGVDSKTASWPHDPDAFLQFTCAHDACYVLGLARGARLSGSAILKRCRDEIARGRRIEVIGVTCDTVGFYERMLERGMIDEFTQQDVDEFFGVW